MDGLWMDQWDRLMLDVQWMMSEYINIRGVDEF